MSNDLLTNNAGAPVVYNENALTAGPRGPMLLQDTWFLEKLAHFDREVIPERRMHAKGSGAYGTFTVTHEIPVALIRIEFDGEAADVAFGVSGAAFARNRGETHEQIGFFADLGEQV